jgi:hypothetical protein
METNLTEKIIDILKIENDEKEFIQNIIKKKNINDELLDTNLQNQINELVKKNNELQKYQDENTLKTSTNISFDRVKTKLKKLQILALLKKLEKCNDISDIYNEYLRALNNNLTLMNQFNAIKDESDTSFYNKYIIYKLKYISLKN